MMARCKLKKCPETGKYLKNNQAQKKGLNRVIADAAWGKLRLKTKAVAAKLGLIVIDVNPRFSSQQCSCCGHIDKANRDKERFLCTECGYVEDADIQASLNLLDRGLKQLGISPTQLRQVLSKVTLKDLSSGLPDEPRNPRQIEDSSGELGSPAREVRCLFEWREDRVIGL